MTRSAVHIERCPYFNLSVLSLLCVLFLCASCSKKPNTGEDDKVTTLGSIEVTAQLLEIRGKIIDDPLYDYAHVMKYKVLKVHRGKVNGDIIYVGHYNPAEPRSTVADARVPKISRGSEQWTYTEWLWKYPSTITTWEES